MNLETDGIRLRVSDPARISPPGERHWFPRLFHMPDGRVLQFNAIVDDTTSALSEGRTGAARISADGGATWTEFPMPTSYGFPVTLADDRVRLFSYIIWQADGVATGRWSDWTGDGWTPEQRYTIDLPPTRDKVPGVSGFGFDRTVMLDSDGALLATIYGKYEDDAKYRCVLVRSTDEGRTWSTVSTIAYDPDLPVREGYNEPVMARVADGSLLCVMRTGGRTDTLRQARSLDGGHTWSRPQDLGVLSVDPDLCLMSNGLLALSFGRPTVNLMFSRDGAGHTWTPPVTLFTGNSTCYTGLREVAPGRLLLVYDSNPAGSPWEAHDNQVNRVLIDVEV